MNKKILGILVMTLLIATTVLPALGNVNSENTLTKNTVLYNDPPEADAGGPYNAEEGTEILFDASGSHDPDGDELIYIWDFDGDGEWDTEWLHESLVYYSYGDDYDGIVNLAVTDGDSTDYDHSSVLINNVAPTVDAGLDQIVNVGETVQYNGFFNDLGFLDNHVFSWAFGGLCADKEKLNATVNLISIKFSQFVHEWKCDITTNGERIFDLHFFLIVGDMSDSFQNGKEGIPKGFPKPPDSTVKIHPNGYMMNVTFNDGLPDNYQFSIYTKVKDIDDNVGIQWTTTKSGGEETNTGNMGKPNSPIGPFEKIYDEPGFYNSVLTIYDDDGGSDIDTMTVQVVDNLPPFSPSISRPRCTQAFPSQSNTRGATSAPKSTYFASC